ncbi:hypothetical protein HUK80_14865 [Flavobacterium sp. MAH-1]|uniref:Uncharacterized protein n=1 Tax=Flavobacterium agri TaxID=2743471 RepID=A0A7Y8Y5D0_9FLAO|nr:hypothetical protein [Flavobacterium agri]NUY82184.1 hypothetical protein [Flavobacterium agri]NYA72208.1 hypothetical protein [Flavobacterium agri]
MKTSALLLALLTLAVGCNQQKKDTATASETTATNAVTTTTPATPLDETCQDETTLTLRRLGQSICGNDGMTLSHITHNIDSNDFKRFFERKYPTNPPAMKELTWQEIQNVIGTNTCYDKFVQFDFDATSANNSTIRPSLVDCYDKDANCYSIVLFNAIARRQNLLPGSKFEFSRGIDDSGREMVMFRIQGGKSYYHFDISTVPYFYNMLLKIHKQEMSLK